MNESISDMSHTSTSVDQLQLPEDVVGQLLLLLEDSDIQRCRLVSSAWQQAVDHQIRELSPLHLPVSTPAVFSSCEIVRSSLLHRVGSGSRQPSLDAISNSSALPGRDFSWAAPIRNFNSICSSMRHAAALDISAQQLPADCITQLAQHMPRLKSLKLDACKLSADQLCSLANFADANRTAGADGVGLSQLSLAGIQLSRPSALPAREGTSRKDRLHAELLAQQAVRDAIDLRAAPGAADAGTSVRGVDTLEVLLDAIAANALTHLNLCRTVQPDLLFAVAGRPLAPAPVPAVSLLTKCSHLSRLSSSLVSLKVLGQMFNADDWHHICSNLTLLTELHLSWDSEAARLELDAAAFQGIGKLQRLQSLRVHFIDPRGPAYEPYTLEPVAQNLTAVHLTGSNSLSLLLSLMGCCNMRQLRLQDISGVAGTPELLVQLVRSMPLLEQLHLSRIQAPNLDRVGCCHTGDYLLSQLDCCCPHLTKLVMPNVELNGTGIRLAAGSPVLQADPLSTSSVVQTAAPAAPAAGVGSSSTSQLGPAAGASAALAMEGMPGSGGLRRMQHLELNGSHLMSSALPHLSCLTGLRSLALMNMQMSQFTHACRFDCFRFVAALTNLTSLDISGASVLRSDWLDHVPAAAAAAAALGGGPVNAINQGDDDGADGDFIEIDLFQPFDAEPDSNDEDEDEDDFVDSGSSGNDGYIASSDSSSGEGGGSHSDEWEDADDGHFPEAAPPAGQQPQAAAAAAAGQALGVAAPGPGAAAQPGQQLVQVALQGADLGAEQQLMQQAEAAMQALDAVAAQFQQQQQQGAEPGAAAQELQAVHQQAQAAVGAAAAALQQNFQDLQQELSAAAQHTAAAVMEPHMHFVGRLRGLVSLNLGCLCTGGPCLMHLSALTRLQTLVLSGSILLDTAALQLLGNLRLPSVVNLSVTTVKIAACFDVECLADQSVQASSSGSRRGGSAAGGPGRMREMGSLDHFVGMVLCAAFPSCVNLKLGMCDRLSICGLATLLQRLPKLQRVWLLGTVVWGPSWGDSPVPYNFVPTPAAAARQCRRHGPAGSSHQQQQQQESQLVSGYVLPCDPRAAGALLSRSQRAEEFGWFLEHGVVIPPETYASAAAAAAAVPASQPVTTGAAAAATAAAAAMVAAASGRGGAAEVPKGAVALPFVAGSGLKFVAVSDKLRFTRYMDRMVRV